MAEQGICGMGRLFEGTYVVCNSSFGGQDDRAAMIAGLGTRVVGSGTLSKRWPRVGTAHGHSRAATHIVSDRDLPAEGITGICLRVGEYLDLMCKPLTERSALATLANAKFCLPFLVDIATVRRGLSVTDFAEAGRQDRQILASVRKFSLIPDSDLDWRLDLPLGRVDVVARSGATYLREGRAVLGPAGNPENWEAVRASASAAPLPAGRLREANGWLVNRKRWRRPAT